MVGEDDQRAGGIDERAIDLGLHEVRSRETAVHTHPVNAQEELVDVLGTNRRNRERPDKRVRGRAYAARYDHRLVERCAVPVEDVRNRNRVRHDSEIRNRNEVLRQMPGCRPG